MYMCSGIEQKKIADAIKRENPDGVVMATCTPSLHYETFAKAVESAGLSRFRYELATIREHSNRVHYRDREGATKKAIKIVSITVAKLKGNAVHRLVRGKITKKALVIDGGIAGITATPSIAKAGIPVDLIERDAT